MGRALRSRGTPLEKLLGPATELENNSPVKYGIRHGTYVIGDSADVIEQVEYEHLLAGWLAHIDGHKSLSL